MRINLINRSYIKTAFEHSRTLAHSFTQKIQAKSKKNSLPINIIDSDSKFLGVCFKILLNYMQMIGIVASFDMKWPVYARGFFSLQSGVGNLSTQFFSLDCFAQGFINFSH